MSIELRIASLTGLAPSAVDGCNAYLGVSFSKTTYFSRPVMEAYVNWACARCPDLLIIVADHLEAYNASAFRGIPFREAEERTLRTGTELRRAYEKAVAPSLRDRVRIELASEILQKPQCRDILALVRSVAGSNIQLRQDTRRTVLYALGGKLESMALPQDDALDTLVNYIAEEIAIILFITGASDPKYQLSIFPYRPPQILIDLYAGAYGTAFDHLTLRRPYAAIELVRSAEPSTHAERAAATVS